MFQTIRNGNQNDIQQNSCMNPLYTIEVLLLLLVIGFIIYKLMLPNDSSCSDMLALSATPGF